jgi:CheY-like chemotaxis protein
MKEADRQKNFAAFSAIRGKRAHTQRFKPYRVGMGPSKVGREQTLRVLLVDDDADVLAMLEAVLTTMRFDVVGLAANGEDAVRVAATIELDMAVVDYMMPGLTGFETAARIKKLQPECAVVIFSALDVGADADAHPAVDHFVLKSDILGLDRVLSEMRAARQSQA